MCSQLRRDAGGRDTRLATRDRRNKTGMGSVVARGTGGLQAIPVPKVGQGGFRAELPTASPGNLRGHLRPAGEKIIPLSVVYLGECTV